ncbi:uncharacterized protein, 4-oxalocrotonate tautomerase [Beggiatoa alba B18LD]|uniref:Uncharacterized protein, 4-oxalocrotonate tautomerase n=1 Tax=Beggiatoa alba B18LD TaxID=395493 RepID=I3CGR5_9GAMM|nr:GNAT family N-acetyltransferase [Beggiatoa alba]EIJ42808.1 uncharacterized protein, 4-oxalocrotonate tautomerase [Beggiatoa alba B18LD]
MPYLQLKLASSLTPEQLTHLARTLTQLMADILHKDPQLTALSIEPLPNSHWFIHGELQHVGAHLQINITKGTNTDAEKAQMIQAAAELLQTVLNGQLPQATYIIIHEIDATAWGYDGLTQAQRKQTKLKAKIQPLPEPVHYEKTGIEGLPLIEPLWQQLNQLHLAESETFAPYYATLTFPTRQQALLNKAKQGQLLVQLAKYANQYIGYCVSTVTAGIGEIDSIFIEQTYRHLKVGETFLKQASDWMNNLKVETKRVTVYAGNESVLAFYAKYGFHKKYLILEQV